MLSNSQLASLFGLVLIGSVHTSNSITGPFTNDFQSWLKTNDYSYYDYTREDYGTQGSFGGRANATETISNTPVVFIHGNSDAALHKSSLATGWSNSIEYFLENGYTTAELYATSWQDTDALNAASRVHDCTDLVRLRKFLEAVLAYTGAPKISVITHSMGVTLGRRIIKGGDINLADEKCSLGASLSSKVEVFVGLSGANYGLCNCEGASATLEKTCNRKNGLWPGDSCGLNYLDCGLSPLPWPCSNPTYSTFLMNMNADKKKEADYVFSAWSHADELIAYNNMVWGQQTSLIPTSDASIIYNTYGHMETKDMTAVDQYKMVKHFTVK